MSGVQGVDIQSSGSHLAVVHSYIGSHIMYRWGTSEPSIQ